MFGVVPAIVDKQGHELSGVCEGFLVVKQPWPGQMRTVYGDHKRFEITYFAQFNGYYCTGDGWSLLPCVLCLCLCVCVFVCLFVCLFV